MTTTTTTMSRELAALCAQLKQWRQQGGGGRGKRVPAILWLQAAAVAQADGAWKTARATRLNYDRLRAQMASSDAAGAEQAPHARMKQPPRSKSSALAPSANELARPSAQFVAVQMKPSPRTSSLTIELSRKMATGCGSRAPARWISPALCTRCGGVVIQVGPHTRVLLAVEPVDFRSGIDRLCRICRAQLSSDPFGGTLFIFRNRQATSIKILAYDGQGFWLCQKRLSTGKFRYWPGRSGSVQHPLVAHELQVLLMGGDPEATGAAPPWRPIQPRHIEERDTLSPVCARELLTSPTIGSQW